MSNEVESESTPEGPGIVRFNSPSDALEHATNLSKATIAGSHYRKPENVLFVAELGRAFHLEPAVAMRMIYAFDSGEGVKTAISSDLMVKLARDAGHFVHVSSGKGPVIATLVRGDFTEERVAYLKSLGFTSEEIKDMSVFKEEWNDERALLAGLLKKQNWLKYKPDMLRARALASVIRRGAPEVLAGSYTPDELGAVTNAMGEPDTTVTVTRVPASTKAAKKAEVSTDVVETVDAEIADPTAETEPDDSDAVDAEEVQDGEEDSTEQPAPPEAQTVLDFAISVVNDPKMPHTKKVAAIHGAIRNVGTYGMNDHEVQLGDEVVGLESALMSLAKLVVNTAKKKQASAA